MKATRQKRGSSRWGIFLILIVSSAVLCGGYWLYQRSIGRAVYSTTISFMEQIADHDRLNIVNQMNSQWEYLNSILERIRTTRDSRLEEVAYALGVESNATHFYKLYLVTEDGRVYSSSYVESSIADMPWQKYFEQANGKFVSRHSENKREQWGEYLIYGYHQSEPIPCGDRKITGIVGLVPISEITSQMRMESFDGKGVAVVIRPSGEIITASQYYGGDTAQNFLTPLKNAVFEKGESLDACRQAIQQGRRSFIEYVLDGERFYALFQPMGNEGGNDWSLVVRVSSQVTEEQVKALLMRSLPFFLLLGLLSLVITFFVYHNMNAARIARASEQAKSAFFANMSHEIRTPLNGIVGLHYLMRQNLGNPEALAGYLTKAEVSAEFLKSVITDVLDMSKIESGQLEIYKNEMDLSKLVKEIETLVGIQTEERGLRFQVDCVGLAHPFVMGDALRIKQVLTNLLGNALKFTPKGGQISLTVRQELAGSVADTTFVVSDTGCGMSPEFLERIWLPFEQEQRLASQNGTGLGTTLSKTLVEKMGGSITVASRPGEGTAFTVSLPLPVTRPAAAKAPAARQGREWELKGKRILVAEDNEINRMIIVSILEDQGCLLTECEDGGAATAAFEESPPFYFDLILMDVQMPVLDGYGATRRIRGLVRPDAASIPIIAMTANAFREDIDKALASGMNDVATKPIDIHLLLKKIKNLENQGEA